MESSDWGGSSTSHATAPITAAIPHNPQVFPLSFDDAKDLKKRVQELELATGKEISNLGDGASSSKNKIYVCRHYIEIKKAYEAKVKQEKGIEYLKVHPFRGDGACAFRIAARKSKAKGGDSRWFLSSSTVLQHNPTCSSVLKVKKSHLMADQKFRAALHDAAAGDKMSLKSVKAVAHANGFGDAATPASVLKDARADAIREHDKLYFEKFTELPSFLHQYANEHPLSYYKIKTTGNVPGGKFEAAFCMFGPALQYIRLHGKDVSGADFGHSRHRHFVGVEAIGMFQTGSGKLIPVWAAVFGGSTKNECGWAWGWCAEQLVICGAQDLYNGKTCFTDRAKGASYFDAKFATLTSVYCGRHILANARAQAPKSEKIFHDNMFWRLQGSVSEMQYWHYLGQFEANYPTVKSYLQNIPRGDFIRYDQVNRGARMYGWRTSNQAETGQSVFKEARMEHPLDFFHTLALKVADVITQDQKNHAEWRVQPEGELGLVPDALVALRRSFERAVASSVRKIGPAKYHCKRQPAPAEDPGNTGSSMSGYCEHIVDLARGTCTCLKPQDHELPCTDVMAAHIMEKRSLEVIIANDSTLHRQGEPDGGGIIGKCYKLARDAEAINTTVPPLPTLADLEERRKNKQYSAHVASVAALLGIPVITAPPVRNRSEEGHGHNKRNRKKVGGGLPKTARRKSGLRSFAVLREQERRKNSKNCAKCTAAGRVGDDFSPWSHKGHRCPWERQSEVVVIYSSDSEGP